MWTVVIIIGSMRSARPLMAGTFQNECLATQRQAGGTSGIALVWTSSSVGIPYARASSMH